MHYYNARYYDAHIRRFTQPDDVVQDVYDPQSLNRYAYVRNNPLRYTDPSGHFVFAIPAVYWAAAVVTAVTAYFETPQGRQVTKAAISTAVNAAKSAASAVTSAVSSAVKSATTYFNKPAASPPSSNTPRSGPSENISPKGPSGGIIGGAVGAINAAGQQIQVHGNDLRSTATTWGYTLRNAAGEIIKYGQSINPDGRYSRTWLKENGLDMVKEIVGSKMDMRIWEHEQIGNYLFENGEAPLLNDISRSVNVFK